MKILPCLRCGSENIQIEAWDPDCKKHCAYRCFCENRHYWDEWLDTEEEAIKAWNERI
jgi:hypothetical protein